MSATEPITDLFGHTQYDKLPGGQMCQRFIEPPFSVLDTKTGRWQDRKRDWSSLGIQSELGRDGELTFSNSMAWFDYYRVKEGERQTSQKQDTSIFDPVLCELVYSWFYPNQTNHGILDPFAGGSVRGIVAARLGLQYTGIDLRREQIEANYGQALKIPCDPKPHWICGDSDQIHSLVGSYYDLIFTCPPYWNLETYSDLSADISRIADYGLFIEKYGNILRKTVGRLHGNRFTVLALGNVRDAKGAMRDLCGDTVRIMQDAGMILYNDIVILSPIGSLPMRTNKQFSIGRKVGNAHQRLLVFYKGDPENIRFHYSQFND
jgi:hypothetical protein